MSTMITKLVLGSIPLTLSFRAGNFPSKFRKKFFWGKYHVKFRHLVHFSWSQNPGIKASPILGFGIEKMGQDGIPRLESVVVQSEHFPLFVVTTEAGLCNFYRDNEEDDTCSPERKKKGQRFRPLMTLKQRRRSLLSATSLPIQIPNRTTGLVSDGVLQQDSGIPGSPVDRWKRALRQVHTLSDPWAKLQMENLPTEKAKRCRYSALKKKWVTDEVSVKMENEVCC